MVIEAPLSVCFDAKGNPKGRSVEKDGARTRYWYCGAGAVVMVAATYMIRDIHESGSRVRLFEGFVSFKKKSIRSDHLQDARQLREAVKNSERSAATIYSAEKLKMDPGDVLTSACSMAGIDCGIPAVIKLQLPA